MQENTDKNETEVEDAMDAKVILDVETDTPTEVVDAPGIPLEEAAESEPEEVEADVARSRLEVIFNHQANIELLQTMEEAAEVERVQEGIDKITEIQGAFSNLKTRYVTFRKVVARKVSKKRKLTFIVFNKDISDNTGVHMGILKSNSVTPLNPSSDLDTISRIHEWLTGFGDMDSDEGLVQIDVDVLTGVDLEFSEVDSDGEEYMASYDVGEICTPGAEYPWDAVEEEEEEEAAGDPEDEVASDPEPSESELMLEKARLIVQEANTQMDKPWNNDPKSMQAIQQLEHSDLCDLFDIVVAD